MLRSLQARPEELSAISGQETQVNKPATTPFDVTSEHLSALNPRDFSALVEKLLSAEAQEWNLPLDRIHVAMETNAPDGGEDARIEWQGGPKHTNFLPNRFCLFQLKTGDVSQSKAGKDVLNKEETQLKPMVREALEKGGSYIMLCSAKSYTKQGIKKREGSIQKNLKKHGLKEPHIQFRDSGQITSWVNYHPSVAIWLLRKTRPDLIDLSFGDWKHWSGRLEHSNSPWVDDPRLPGFREKLRAIVETPKGVARVLGPYGTGKSRLTLEAFSPTETEKTSGVKLSELVLYAVESETDSQKIKDYAKILANTGKRVVLVINRCLEETRIDLGNIVKHSNSCLSLVTIIDCEIPREAEESENMLVVDAAESLFTEKIVRSVNPDILELDRRRIIAFSEGNIGCAQIIAKSWQQKGLTASEDEDFLIRKFLGHDNQEYVYETAMLISTFSGVETETIYREKPELEKLVEFLGTISIKDSRYAIQKLKRRGVIYQQGNSVILEPKHIALILTEQQWQEWNTRQWEKVLVGSLPEQVRARAAKQLAFLNTKPIATKVTRHICKNRMFWHSPKEWGYNLKILVWLAEIDSLNVVNVLKDILDPLEQPQIKNITGSTRSDLIATLTKLAFRDDTFEEGAMLLFKLACGENENIINNATGQFKSLFPVQLATTEADPEKRFTVIDELVDEHDNNSNHGLSIVVDALLEGAKTHHFHRDIGPEIHGSRPALESWLPKTHKEYWDYVKECVSRLVELAKRPDHIGQQARAGLGLKWHKYVVDGLIEDVERWSHEIKEKHPCWPEAINSLEALLMYSKEKLKPPVEQRVEALISALTPDNLGDRTQFLITEMPSLYLRRKDMDLDTMFELQCEELKKLAAELLGQKIKLVKLIPELCTGQHRNARLFGLFMAEEAQDPLYWKKKIMEAYGSISGKGRNSDFLTGYMTGLKERNLKELKRFKRESVKSPVFAPVLPALTSRTGIGSDDVGLIIEALESSLISHREMVAWTFGNALSKLQPAEIVPLLDLLLKKDDSSYFGCALGLMYSYVYKQKERLEYLRPQLLLAARYPMIKTEEVYDKSHYEHCYETLMNWIISKGSTDADARKVAITIAKQLVAEDLTYNDERMIAQVLPDLLSNFAEIVWPLISRTLTEDNNGPFNRSWRVSMILRGEPSSGNNPIPILSLPENMLLEWCHANPEIGPAFIAGTFPLLKGGDQETGPEEFHPVIKRLLDEFGECKDVLSALAANMRAFSGWGSKADHLTRYKEPLQSIEDHEKRPVQRWAKKMLKNIKEYSLEG